MEICLTIILGVGAALLLWYLRDQVLTSGLPPGPLRVPCIGSLWLLKALLVKEPPYVTFRNLRNKYGSIVTVKFGVTLQVSDATTIREVLFGENWADRPDNSILNKSDRREKGGIIFSNGERWKELRRFSIRTLREFGFGKERSQEAIMQEELCELMADVNEKLKCGNDVQMHHFFHTSVLNILWSMISGQRFAHGDEAMQALFGKLSLFVETLSLSGNLLLAFPFLRRAMRIFPSKAWAGRMKCFTLRQDLEKILHERRALGRYRDEQRDFMDVFLKEIDRSKGKAEPIYTEIEFVRTIIDLFGAGSETTSNTCEFVILYMLLNPDVQRRVQKEIDAVIGRGRFPNADDRRNMPYTEATILEVQRMANVTPIIARSPTKDVRLGPYNIPKGTFVVLDVYNVHMDPEHWEDPHLFRPERFLNNNDVVHSEKLLVFGGGKRVCLGEVLARATLFTYISTMLQNYSFTISAKHPVPDLSPRFGLTMTPQPFYAHITHRPL